MSCREGIMVVHFFVMSLIPIVVFICCVANVSIGFRKGQDRSVDVIVLYYRHLEARRRRVYL